MSDDTKGGVLYYVRATATLSPKTLLVEWPYKEETATHFVGTSEHFHVLDGRKMLKGAGGELPGIFRRGPDEAVAAYIQLVNTRARALMLQSRETSQLGELALDLYSLRCETCGIPGETMRQDAWGQGHCSMCAADNPEWFEPARPAEHDGGQP